MVAGIPGIHRESCHPKANLVKTDGELSRFALRDHQGGDSALSTAIPISAQGNSKPARVMLIHGKTEALPVNDIIRKLDTAVRFGGDQFKVGQSEWGNDDL